MQIELTELNFQSNSICTTRSIVVTINLKIVKLTTAHHLLLIRKKIRRLTKLNSSFFFFTWVEWSNWSLFGSMTHNRTLYLFLRNIKIRCILVWIYFGFRAFSLTFWLVEIMFCFRKLEERMKVKISTEQPDDWK